MSGPAHGRQAPGDGAGASSPRPCGLAASLGALARAMESHRIAAADEKRAFQKESGERRKAKCREEGVAKAAANDLLSYLGSIPDSRPAMPGLLGAVLGPGDGQRDADVRELKECCRILIMALRESAIENAALRQAAGDLLSCKRIMDARSERLEGLLKGAAGALITALGGDT